MCFTFNVTRLQAMNAVDQFELGVENGQCRFLNNSYQIVNFFRRRLPIDVALCAACTVFIITLIDAKNAIASQGGEVLRGSGYRCLSLGPRTD